MGKALIIGAGGVAGVVIHKCCQNSEVFTEICRIVLCTSFSGGYKCAGYYKG